MSDKIRKVQASIERLHGGEREQAAKYQNFLAWQIARRQIAKGDEPSSILKTTNPEFEQ